LASFRNPGKAASLGARLPPDWLLSGSKMQLSVSTPTALHGEALYFQPPANQEGKPLYDLASFRHPCDASCKKSPPDASQNLDPSPQPIEKGELATS
jgi:hypothetical protein